MLSEQAIAAIKEQKSRYPGSRSALLHALYIAQRECGGWVPHEAVYDVAEAMEMEPADVQSTMSFYVLFNKEPVGKYLLEVCHNISCAVMGSGQLFQVIENKLGLHPGETTEDKLFTLKGVECLAACGGAPCLQVNGLFRENVTPQQMGELIDRLREGKEDVPDLYWQVYNPEATAKG